MWNDVGVGSANGGYGKGNMGEVVGMAQVGGMMADDLMSIGIHAYDGYAQAWGAYGCMDVVDPNIKSLHKCRKLENAQPNVMLVVTFFKNEKG